MSGEENMDAIRKDLESAIAVNTTTEDEAKVATPIIKCKSNQSENDNSETKEGCDTNHELQNNRHSPSDEQVPESQMDDVHCVPTPAMYNEVEVSAITAPYEEVEVTTSTAEDCNEVEVSTCSDAKDGYEEDAEEQIPSDHVCVSSHLLLFLTSDITAYP